jgi:PadR family transcriptional regulator, regulatory protein PadR
MELKDLQRSSAEVVLLALLEGSPRHGYELAKLVESQSGHKLQYQVASIYPMLYRLEKKGLVRGHRDEPRPYRPLRHSPAAPRAKARHLPLLFNALYWSAEETASAPRP